jgi:hypothetical protein
MEWPLTHGPRPGPLAATVAGGIVETWRSGYDASIWVAQWSAGATYR